MRGSTGNWHGRIALLIAMLVPCGLSVLSYGSGGGPAVAAGTSGAGGAISLASPIVNEPTVTIDITTSAPVDPYYAWNVHVRWDPSILSYESIASQANICGALADSDGGGAILGCSIPGGSPVSDAGTLAMLTLRASGAGCSVVHLVTYEGGDSGDRLTGTYTLNATDLIPQSNTYGGDVAVNLGGGCGALVPGAPACGTSPVAYDVDGSGVVDTPDLAAVGKAFPSTPASPNWNPAADVNGNGFVGPDDALLVSGHFGQQTAPCPTNTPTSTPTPCPGTCPTDTPTATPSRTPTRIPFPTITPTGTATPVPIPCESQCDLSGFWHMDTTSGSAAMPTGNCSSSLTQLTETTFSGPLSCTGGSVGTIDVTIDLASSAISSGGNDRWLGAAHLRLRPAFG